MDAYGLAAAGETAEARVILKTLAAQAASEDVEADLIARFHAALGENDHAFQWLDRGLAEGSVTLLLLGGDPAFRPLHRDPRFEAFMRRAGLPL